MKAKEAVYNECKAIADSFINGQLTQMKEQISAYGYHNFVVDFAEMMMPYDTLTSEQFAQILYFYSLELYRQ